MFEAPIGVQFGRWTVIAPAANDNRNRKRVVCKCSCDKQTVRLVRYFSLVTGRSQSCGCLQREKVSPIAEQIGKENTKHGQYLTAEYRAWCGMKNRCTNPNNKDYERYGARGITVCPEWMDSFEQFFLDMGPRPPGMSLDRIDNDSGYEKSNCRWTDAKTQANNRRPMTRRKAA